MGPRNWIQGRAAFDYAGATTTVSSAAPRRAPSTSTSPDNAIIPLKERVVDRFYDPITRMFRIFK